MVMLEGVNDDSNFNFFDHPFLLTCHCVFHYFGGNVSLVWDAWWLSDD